MEEQTAVAPAVAQAGWLTLSLHGAFDPVAGLARHVHTLGQRALGQARQQGDGSELSRLRAEWSFNWAPRALSAQDAALGANSPAIAASKLESLAVDLERWIEALPDRQSQVLVQAVNDLAASLGQAALILRLGAPTANDARGLFTAFERTVGFSAVTSPLAPVHSTSHELIRFGYGSPWYVDAFVMLGSAGASLAGLIYGIKRLSGIDLEVRVHRAELQAKLERARLRLQHLQALDDGDMASGDSVNSPMDVWTEREALVDHADRTDFFPWVVQGAVLSDEEPAHRPSDP